MTLAAGECLQKPDVRIYAIHSIIALTCFAFCSDLIAVFNIVLF